MNFPPAVRQELQDEVRAAIRNVLSVSLPDHQVSRITDRFLAAYRRAAMGKTGTRLKDTTYEIMALEVGEAVEVEASCKANLHGQFKTIRRKLVEPDRKWRVEQVRPGVWRVERRPDGAWNLKKSPLRNPKAVFLANLQLDGRAETYPGVTKPNQIINCHTKNKARDLLGDKNAEWSAYTSTVNGVVYVRRTR